MVLWPHIKSIYMGAAIVRAGPGATVRPIAELGVFWHSGMELLAGREALTYNQTPLLPIWVSVD